MNNSCRPSFRLPTITCGALLLILFIRACPGCARTLTLAQYDQRLAQVQTAADAYAMHPPTSQKAPSPGVSSTAAVQTALAPIVHCVVAVPGRDGAGTLVMVDNRPTFATLKRIDRETDPARRNQFLAGLHDQLILLRAQTKSLASANVQGQRAVQTARSVLSTDEFASDPIPPPSAFERQMDKIAPWIDKQLNKLAKLFRPSGAPLPDFKIDPRVPLGILIVIAVIAGGLLIAFLARLLTGANWARFRQSRSGSAETGLALTQEEASLVAARDFDQLLALARQRAEEGDYRSAFRLVYLSSLVALDRQGLVRLNKSRTNWEYLRAVRQSGNEGLYDALLPMTRGFDRIWYGLRPATRTDYEQALTGHTTLRTKAGIS